jgi:uroporphyrin-III C-methyltransferase|mmetsp:Transcript_101477/g.160463  ORF Transcript_101477/g.160463 Transcript_101477/m.160463 type:complete len:294 (-) Transcript_101477:58-939(-)|eukprot:CAMPEP_0169077700 /NCGR_PEP_ID=MMETSP1015-20121227/9020_1 /TAXON_ID=342587 /ORGANISM="Karlodinium micrum, Strain CCMP2283" /LENGTH=293 /DNA_ID=CAMNT_0009137245 /DNA_START=56 /DNA_END=937 /DNA_ORIENTATION=+
MLPSDSKSFIDAFVTKTAPAPCDENMGLVSLVGAGPGDPDLMTVRAVRRLEAAEVVLHDNLISDDVLAMVPKHAELINVGKRCGDPKDRGLQQQEIHDLLLLHCRRCLRVVRLKCGDPFVFGRGGEEVEFLAKHGVSAEVVPGITTALGAAASCQVPLTHRSYGANQVRFVVGQSKAHALPDLDWSALARETPTQTVVFYMGLKSLSSICERLRSHGAASDTPMALVESATMPGERAFYGTLETMPELAKKQEAGDSGPVIIFVGPTAAFPSNIQASSSRPLKRARVDVSTLC